MRLYLNKYPISDNAEYVVDYIFNSSTCVSYYQLVRIKDDAILCTGASITYIMLHCWNVGILKQKVAFI